ncbi:MAG: hypothetical protein HY255_00185 [Betaproteobacteria bacterium]|nr:hypothetical protein [Betaproteobacteria bacterium]
MKLTHWIALFVPLIVAASHSHADVTDSPKERALSLGAGTPQLSFPRGDWIIIREQRREAGPAFYYMLGSEKSEIFLSVYIERSKACQNATDCLTEALKNPSYKEAKDSKPVEAGNLKAIQFYLDQPKGAPVKQVHVLAAGYVDGVWFDIHLSKTGMERPSAAPLAELLSSLAIR